MYIRPLPPSSSTRGSLWRRLSARAGVASLLVAATAAQGKDSEPTMTFTDQDRSVAAWYTWTDAGGGDSSSASDQASAFEPFDTTVTAGGTAAQQSSLDPGGVSAIGNVQGSVVGRSPLSEELDLESELSVTLMLTQPAQLDLSGSVDASDFSLAIDALASIELRSIGGANLFSRTSNNAGTFQELLILDAGTYTLEAVARLSGHACCNAGAHDGHAAFQIQAIVGAIVDCNGNGQPDVLEIASGAQDCNGDGTLDACELDCNGDGQPDTCELAGGAGSDCNGNGIPDPCDLAGGKFDADGNGLIDACELGPAYVQQDRSVMAMVESPGPVDLAADAASGLGPFQSDVTAAVISVATAEMISAPHAGGVTAFGRAESALVPGGEVAVATAAAHHELTFLLEDVTAYTLDAHLSTGGGPFTVQETALLLRRSEAAPELQVTCVTADCDVPISTSGMLEPGEYKLIAHAEITAATGAFPVHDDAVATFELDLQLSTSPPCPADTDDTGAVDIEDLIAVLLDWDTDGAINGADIDGSGLVDVDDLIIVIVEWGPC